MFGMSSPFESRTLRNPFTGERVVIREAVIEAAEHLQAVCDVPAIEARMELVRHAGDPVREAMESRSLLDTLASRYGLTAQDLRTELAHAS